MPSNQTREQLDERNRIQKTRYANDEEYRKGVAERGKEWRDKYQWTRTEKQKLYREENRNEINVRALSSYHKKKKVIYDLLGNECKHCVLEGKGGTGGRCEEGFSEYVYYEGNRHD